MRKIIASLDIGSHTIKLVVGEIVRNKLNILACVDSLSRGIKKGFIVNPESTIEALDDVFKKCEDTYWHSYIYLGYDGKLWGFSNGGIHKQTDTNPATKEQRDVLMKVMNDAGY